MSSSSPEEPKSPPEGTTPPLDRVRHEMERWLDVARSTGERALETLGLGTHGRHGQPLIDVIEVDTEILVHVELPGVAAESVQLSLAGNMLTVKAARSEMDLPDSARRHLSERSVAIYERAIPLPAAVDGDNVRAETRDGLLTVTLKKTVVAAGRSIPVSRPAPTSML